MPVELGIWRIDRELSAIEHHGMDNEARLEVILSQNIEIVAPHLMVIGRQVQTPSGKLDLLAIDSAGNLAVVELKRDQTPREVVAQVLDYGSWVHTLQSSDIAGLWQEYAERYRPAERETPLDQAFCKRFSVKSLPEELNSEHELVIVASALDDSTERVVDYLAGYHDININAILFRLFRDGDREYLTRAWLRDPTSSNNEPRSDSPKVSWNKEYYVTFGGGRDWEEARQFGFIAAGGGSWYSNTLQLLSPKDRIWVYVPGSGYVGVGIVQGRRERLDDFMTETKLGAKVPITNLAPNLAKELGKSVDAEKAEYLVRVKWIKTVPLEDAVNEVGFFSNQNTVARPKNQKWVHTVIRLKQRFGIED